MKLQARTLPETQAQIQGAGNTNAGNTSYQNNDDVVDADYKEV